jgi:hypothetical protein
MSANTALVSPSTLLYDFLGKSPSDLGINKISHKARISTRDTLTAMSKAPALIDSAKDLIALQAALTPDKDGKLDLEFTGDRDHVELKALQGQKFYFQAENFRDSSSMSIVNKHDEVILSPVKNENLPWAEIHEQYSGYVAGLAC